MGESDHEGSAQKLALRGCSLRNVMVMTVAVGLMVVAWVMVTMMIMTIKTVMMVMRLTVVFL